MNDQSWDSVSEMFFAQAAKHAEDPLVWAKVDGVYTPQTWAQIEAKVTLLSRALRALGVEPGHRVVIAAENRAEWLVSEMAILAARAIAVPAYTTNTVDDHLHILNNSGAKGAIYSTAKIGERLLSAAHQAQACAFAIAMDPHHITQQPGGVRVYGWDEALSLGAGQPDDVAEVACQAARADTAVIIHTSGTGGTPKGVMLSHGALLHNCHGATELLRGHAEYGKEVFLSFLPLSHSYEHMAGQIFPMSIAAQVYYADGIEHLTANMQEVRPTIMTAVPRLYEVMYQRIRKSIDQTQGFRRTLFDKTIALGSKRYEDPKSLSLWERLLDRLLERLVRQKVRDRYGGRLRYFVSGGAPLNLDIGIFFNAIGVKLLQGYGLTESAPVISCNPPLGFKLHTVGPPVADTEVRIAEDGEILVRGELVMQGYYNEPDATAAAITDGWLHTGDIGRIDEDGFLQITDRKKDIIVNSGGDNIAPQRVEGFLVLQPEIQQAMVFGDRRPHLVALLVPDPDFLERWAKENGRSSSLAELSADAGFREALSDAVDRVNKELSVIERVRRFLIAEEPFSIDNSMMTPTMKIRRHVIKDVYGERLEALYG